MKTNQLHKLGAVLTMIFALALATESPAFAQRRTREYQQEKNEHSRGKYEKHEHFSKRKRNNRNIHDDNRFESRRRHPNYDRNYSYRESENEHRDHDWRWERRVPVRRNYSYYHVPRYNGRVKVYARAPWGAHQPVIIRHRHGDIYCFGGHFYTFYPRYGYVQIELPHDIVFAAVPRGAARVRVGGRLMFRMGDLYFELGSGGYRIASMSPVAQAYGYVDRY